MLLKKWFGLILILKLISSFFSWWLPENGYGVALGIDASWLFGFILPVILLCIYIVIGLLRNKKNALEATDEQFADSCYYLGFIFTVTSIIFALFDIRQLDYNLTNILMRFGAAMLCTVLGLGVRIYLIGFKKKREDLEKYIEHELIESVESFSNNIETATRRSADLMNSLDDISTQFKSSLQEKTNQFAEMAEESIKRQAEHQAQLNEVQKQQSDKFIQLVKKQNEQIAETLEDITKQQAEREEERLKQQEEYQAQLNEAQKNQIDEFIQLVKKQNEQITEILEASAKQQTKRMEESLKQQEQLTETLGASAKQQEQVKKTQEDAHNELMLSLKAQKQAFDDLIVDHDKLFTQNLKNTESFQLKMVEDAHQAMSTLFNDYLRTMEKAQSEHFSELESHKKLMENYFMQTEQIRASMTQLRLVIESLPASIRYSVDNITLQDHEIIKLNMEELKMQIEELKKAKKRRFFFF